MPVVVEVLVAWLVLSPLAALVVAAFLARAEAVAEARREPLVRAAAGPLTALGAVAGHPAQLLVPRPSSPQDDVLQLRLARPEA